MREIDIHKSLKEGKYVLFAYWSDGMGRVSRDLIAAKDTPFIDSTYKKGAKRFMGIDFSKIADKVPNEELIKIREYLTEYKNTIEIELERVDKLVIPIPIKDHYNSFERHYIEESRSYIVTKLENGKLLVEQNRLE